MFRNPTAEPAFCVCQVWTKTLSLFFPPVIWSVGEPQRKMKELKGGKRGKSEDRLLHSDRYQQKMLFLSWRLADCVSSIIQKLRVRSVVSIFFYFKSIYLLELFVFEAPETCQNTVYLKGVVNLCHYVFTCSISSKTLIKTKLCVLFVIFVSAFRLFLFFL